MHTGTAHIEKIIYVYKFRNQAAQMYRALTAMTLLGVH